MKILKFVMYIFYRYYSKGATKDIAYFSALCAVVLLIYIHIFQILLIFDQTDLILPMNKNDARITKYWKLAFFLLPIFLIIAYLVRSKDLKDLSYEESKIRRGGIYLVIYGITSFILLFVLAFARR